MANMYRNMATALVACSALGAAWPLAASAQGSSDWTRLRNDMVESEIVEAGVKDSRVIAAMRATPRHEFVPRAQRHLAYFDMALPIGASQTISPPFIVAYMTEQLDPQPTDKVLEIGTGSGYQAAVLSRLVKEVYTIEIVASLGKQAEKTLRRLKYDNVHTRVGDGFAGWPEAAPFDKIIVTCSPEKVPEPLVEQLAEGGRMIIPVGERYHQNFYLFRKQDGKLESEALRATFFVPMTGAAEELRERQPDPLHPQINNGSFEELLGEEGETKLAQGWHYMRQATIVTDPMEAPEGKNYIAFKNDVPGRGSQALQGFPVDGRKVSRLRLQFSARGKRLRPGQNDRQWPYVAVTFYDERRAVLGTQMVGPFRDSFDWQRYDEVIDVPVHAREGIVRIGLLGGTGELWLDRLSMEIP
jgi:protein-L-isoaspartate(D-aspartate) O-methyltransferase